MTTLAEYVLAHTTRGSCQCGLCIDAPGVSIQPTGHTADLVFFEVAAKGQPDHDTFMELVIAEFPHWLDGNEHNYIQMGANVGDQGVAMQAMGLGALLGVWQLLTPRTVLGGTISDEQCMTMAGMGMVSVQVTEAAIDLGEFSNCDICGGPFEVEDGRAFGYCIEGYHFDDGGTIDMVDEDFHKGFICYTCISAAWDAAVQARRDLTKE